MGFEEILDEPVPLAEIQVKITLAFHEDTNNLPDHSFSPHICLMPSIPGYPYLPYPVIAVFMQRLMPALGPGASFAAILGGRTSWPGGAI
jgi:hypothetical protein